MKTTKAELIERLSVADDCAQVVIKTAHDRFTAFDVRCTSPTSEVVLIPTGDSTSADRIEELELEVKDLEKDNTKIRQAAESAIEKLKDLLEA